VRAGRPTVSRNSKIKPRVCCSLPMGCRTLPMRVWSRAIKAFLRPVERALDRLDHREIEPDGRRPVAAGLDAHAGGANIVPGVRQTPPHRRRKLVEPVYPNGALVERRAAHLPAVKRSHPLRAPDRIELDGRHVCLRENSTKDSLSR